jgi:hypothetical protein
LCSFLVGTARRRVQCVRPSTSCGNAPVRNRPWRVTTVAIAIQTFQLVGAGRSVRFQSRSLRSRRPRGWKASTGSSLCVLGHTVRVREHRSECRRGRHNGTHWWRNQRALSGFLQPASRATELAFFRHGFFIADLREGSWVLLRMHAAGRRRGRRQQRRGAVTSGTGIAGLSMHTCKSGVRHKSDDCRASRDSRHRDRRHTIQIDVTELRASSPSLGHGQFTFGSDGRNAYGCMHPCQGEGREVSPFFAALLCFFSPTDTRSPTA